MITPAASTASVEASGTGDSETACRTNAICAPFAARPPRRWPFVSIGRIRFAPPANGRLRFHVPRLPSGTYHFVVYCAPCYKGPGGSLIDSGPTFSIR